MLDTDLTKHPNLLDTVKIVADTLDKDYTTTLLLHIKKGKGIVSVGEQIGNRLKSE